MDPRLTELAERFGFDVSRARPTRVGQLDTFPTPYHLVVALNKPDKDVLPNLPYHTILRKWQIDIPDNVADLVHDLSSRIAKLMETLRGKESE